MHSMTFFIAEIFASAIFLACSSAIFPCFRLSHSLCNLPFSAITASFRCLSSSKAAVDTATGCDLDEVKSSWRSSLISAKEALSIVNWLWDTAHLEHGAERAMLSSAWSLVQLVPGGARVTLRVRRHKALPAGVATQRT